MVTVKSVGRFDAHSLFGCFFLKVQKGYLKSVDWFVEGKSFIVTGLDGNQTVWKVSK